jgi:hypothetical protein
MSTPGDPTQFTRESAERIGRVVRAAELAVPQAKPLAFDLAELPAKKVFRVCTFTGTWSIDSEKTLTFYNITSTPNTVSAFNIFADIAGGTSSACLTSCGIAKSGTAWYLIAAGCQCG